MWDEVRGVRASKGKVETAIKFWREDVKVADYSEDLGIDGRRILKSILGKYGSSEIIYVPYDGVC
jgi:hypothetical protein